MTAVLARAVAVRLVRTPRAWVAPGAWLALALVLAVASRTSVHGASNLLPGSVGNLVLPLLAFAAVSAVVGEGGMRRAASGLVALGAEPSAAALSTSGVAVGLAASLGALAASLGALLAHGTSDPPLWLDVPLSFVVGALGGAAYAALFCAGASVMGGALRGILLVADFVLGTEAGPLGALFPRAHLLALLGGEKAFDLSRRVSSVALVALALVYLALVVRLTRRRV